MDGIKFSDQDPTMVAKRTFDNMLEKIQSSNLNFHLTISPFSASISLKKSFIKDKFGNVLLPPPAPSEDTANQLLEHEHTLLVAENNHLKQELKVLQMTQESSKETIRVLEQKMAHVEASALKAFEERNVNINSLKKSVKTANFESESHKKDLLAQNKFIKEKEKEIYKLENKCENLDANLKRSKGEVHTLKSENVKLLKKQKVFKKVKSIAVSTNTITPVFTTTLSTTLPLSSIATSPVISETSCKDICLAFTAQQPLPTTITSMDKNMNTITMPKEKEIITTPSVKDHDCEISLNVTVCCHSPQCCTRQPSPPPLGPLTLEQVQLNEEIEKSEKNAEALLNIVIEFVKHDTEDKIDDTIVKLKAVRKVLDPDSELEGHISPFDDLIEMAINHKDALENLKDKKEDEYKDYYEEDDLPRHYYGEEGEILYYDD